MQVLCNLYVYCAVESFVKTHQMKTYMEDSCDGVSFNTVSVQSQYLQIPTANAPIHGFHTHWLIVYFCSALHGQYCDIDYI